MSFGSPDDLAAIAALHLADESRMMFDLTGKVALVTGASRGIGRAIALQLAAQGATVVAAARGDNAAATVAAIAAAGGTAEAVSVDVTDSAALEALPGAIVSRHGRLDILVSNAGITRDQLLHADEARRLGRGDRDEPDGDLHAGAGRDAADAQAARAGASSRSARWSARWATPGRPTTRRRRRG